MLMPSIDIKQRKWLLQLLNQTNAANIPYDGENGELVQLITEFLIDEPTSDDEEGARLIYDAEEHKTSNCRDELEDTTPLVTVCGAMLVQVFQPLMQLWVLHVNACKIKLQRELNYQRGRDGDASCNFLSILMLELSNFNWMLTILHCGTTLLITLNGKQKLT